MKSRGGDAHATSPHHYLYQLWRVLVYKCTNPDFYSWHNYGGRGIRIHSPWIEDYEAFKAYILSELGERPSAKPKEWSLDRIDNDGHYEPGNLRWATRREQLLNQRRSNDEPNVSFRRKKGRLGSWEVTRGGLTKEQAIAYRNAGEAELRMMI